MESLVGQFTRAGRFKRWLAGLGDSIVLVVLLMIVHLGGRPTSALAVVVIVVMLTWSLLKDGFLEGRSPGKVAMGLRVVDIGTGSPCRPGQSALRHVPNVIPLVTLVDYGLILFSRSGRRVGDVLAGTMVIESR